MADQEYHSRDLRRNFMLDENSAKIIDAQPSQDKSQFVRDAIKRYAESNLLSEDAILAEISKKKIELQRVTDELEIWKVRLTEYHTKKAEEQKRKELELEKEVLEERNRIKRELARQKFLEEIETMINDFKPKFKEMFDTELTEEVAYIFRARIRQGDSFKDFPDFLRYWHKEWGRGADFKYYWKSIAEGKKKKNFLTKNVEPATEINPPEESVLTTDAF